MAKPFMSEQDAKDAYLKCVEAFQGMYEYDVYVQNLAVLNGIMAHCMISRFSTFNKVLLEDIGENACSNMV